MSTDRGTSSTPARPLPVYACAICGEEISAKDDLNGGLVSVSVNGHAKAAHRECPSDRGSEA